MSREIFAGITLGNLVYLGVVLLIGMTLALTMRFMAGRVKLRLRRKNRTSLVAQLVDDVEEAVFLWILLATVYIGLLGLPPLADNQLVMQQGFTVVSIVAFIHDLLSGEVVKDPEL